MPKVSIIVPIYNVEEFLPKALDSLVNQTLHDIEIICVNDGSTDNSLEILKAYEKQDKRIIVISQENSGIGPARNRGLEIAQGEYICFLDPDDWFEPNTCELSYNQISKNQNDVLLYGFNEYYNESNIIYKKYIFSTLRKFVNEPNIKLSDTKRNFFTICSVLTMICKRTFLEAHQIKFPALYNFEDNPFFIKALLSANNISIIDKPLYNYRIRGNSSSKKYTTQADDILNARIEILKFLKDNNIKGRHKRATYYYLIKSNIYWFKYFSKLNPKIEKKFFNNIKKAFSYMDYSYIEKRVKEDLKKELYEEFYMILNHSFLLYKICMVIKATRLQKYMSINEAKDKKHSCISIFNIRFNIRKCNKINSL